MEPSSSKLVVDGDTGDFRTSSARPTATIIVEESPPLNPNISSIDGEDHVLYGGVGASSLSSVCTLCNTAFGAGVLGLPYAFKCAGLLGCLMLFILVAVVESFTMYVLSKFAERYAAVSYGSLVRRALGKKTAAALSAVTVIYLWGSSLAYLVVVSDTYTSLSSLHFGPQAWLSQRLWLLLLIGLLLLPMCLPRHLSALEYLSGLSVLAFLYSAAAISTRGIQAVISRGAHPWWSGVTVINTDFNALYAISIVVFGFNCHANVVSVFYELEHYPHPLLPGLPKSPAHYRNLGRFAPKPRSHKLIGMMGAIMTYMTVILIGYTAVGITGYLAYLDNVSSNILNSFPADDILIQIARACIGGVCIVSFPLNHHPARKAWEDLYQAVFNSRLMPGWLSGLLTLLFVGSTVAAAVVVRDLGAVLHLMGGTVASFMVFTLPGLLMMNEAIGKHAAAAAGLGQQQQQQAVHNDLLAVPLLPRVGSSKKSGFRESGFAFAPKKSWWAGLVIVAVSVLVMIITLLTSE